MIYIYDIYYYDILCYLDFAGFMPLKLDYRIIVKLL